MIGESRHGATRWKRVFLLFLLLTYLLDLLILTLCFIAPNVLPIGVIKKEWINEKCADDYSINSLILLIAACLVYKVYGIFNLVAMCIVYKMFSRNDL